MQQLRQKKGYCMIDKKTAAFRKWFDNLPFDIQEIVNKYISRVLESNTSNCKALRQGISDSYKCPKRI
jgi:putative component of toxin-antitoxin plasmid stabilization module